MTQYVDMITRPMIMIAWLHVGGFVYIVTTAVLVMIVNIAAPGMSQYVELMGRPMIMLARLNVRGFMYSVTTAVLVVVLQVSARLIGTVTMLV